MASNSQLATHDGTPVSRKNREIESDLIKSLNKIVNAIKDKLDPRYAWNELSKYKGLYNTIVYDTIREAATRSFLLGGEFAAISLSDQIPVFLTESDTRTIKQISENHTAQFWERMQISVSRRADQIFHNIDRDAIPPESFLNPNYIVTSVAVGVTNISLNIATVKKRGELIDKYRVTIRGPGLLPAVKQRGLVQSARGIVPEIDPDVLDVESLTNSLLLEIKPDLMLLVQDIMTWITSSDERVCPECLSLEGRTFPLDDPNMLIPVIDTHTNCRCRVMPGGSQEL